MKQNKTAVYKIAAPKLKVKTIGYINLIGRNKAETARKGVKMYRSRVTLKAGQLAQKLRSKAGKLFNQCFVQAGILESAVNTAKGMLKAAKGQYMTTAERFTLNVRLWKAQQNLRAYKYSLPYNIRVNLF